MAKLMAENPAKHFRLDHVKGALTPGRDADIMVLTPESYVVDTAKSGNSVAGWSPFDGMTLPYKVAATYVRGRLAYDGAKVLAEPGSWPFRPSARAHPHRGQGGMSGNLPVDAARIAEDIDALARLTEPGRPWTRRVFSPLFLEGRAYIEARMRSAGLETRVDAAGNLIGRRAGNRRAKGVIMLGSHSDTVPDGGRFDGVAGVVAALEIARSLAERGVDLAHDLEIVDFLAEEVSPFGVSCIGSRGMTGQMPEAWLTRRNESGALADALASVGGDPAAVSEAEAGPKSLLSSNCISSRGLCWSGRVATSASSRASLGSLVSRSSSRAGRITPARRRWTRAPTRSSPPPTSC